MPTTTPKTDFEWINTIVDRAAPLMDEFMLDNVFPRSQLCVLVFLAHIAVPLDLSGLASADDDILRSELLGFLEQLDSIKGTFPEEYRPRFALPFESTLKGQLAEYEDKVYWTGCGSGDCPHDSVQECADALVKAMAGEISRCEAAVAQLAHVEKHAAKLDWWAEVTTQCDTDT